MQNRVPSLGHSAGPFSIPERPAARLAPLAVAISGYFWAMLLLLLAVGVPRVEAIFRAFGVPLPGATLLVIDLSHVLIGGLPPAIAAGMLALLLIARLARQPPRGAGKPPSSLMFAAFLFPVPLALIGMTVVALALPVLTCRLRISG